MEKVSPYKLLPPLRVLISAGGPTLICSLAVCRSLLIEKETRTAVVERGRDRERESSEREGEVEGRRQRISVCVC